MKKILLVLMIVLLTACGKEGKLTDNDKEKKYAEMETTLKGYVDEHYNDIKDKLPEETKTINLKITLGNLKELGFNIKNIKNVDTGKSCDLEKTYAIIDQTPDQTEHPDAKYIINIYMQCGDYKSENYPSENPTETE
jgi:uncharacterized protein YjbJ (UPF0337 family)